MQHKRKKAFGRPPKNGELAGSALYKKTDNFVVEQIEISQNS